MQDKIQANGARALGSLAALLLQPRIVRENTQAAELQPRVVDSLLRGASARAPKVAWNACYALSNLLEVAGEGNGTSAGRSDLPTLMGGRILDTLLQALLFSPNFKVRLSASAGLMTPKTASGYCGRLGEALATVCEVRDLSFILSLRPKIQLQSIVRSIWTMPVTVGAILLRLIGGVAV